MKLTRVIFPLCLVAGISAAEANSPVPLYDDGTMVAGAEAGVTIWQRMLPNRFPDTADARRSKCLAIATHDASGAITASWCRALEDAYQAYLANPAASTVCTPSVERDGQRYRFGTTGSLQDIRVMDRVEKQLGRADPAVRCTLEGVTAVFFNEEGVGCNNLNILQVAATPPEAQDTAWGVMPSSSAWHHVPDVDLPCGCETTLRGVTYFQPGARLYPTTGWNQ